MENPYKTLDIPRDASEEMIKQAYKKMAKKHHPDKGGSEKDFLRIQEAYNLLNDPEMRRVYDTRGWDGVEQIRQGGGFGGGGGEMPEFFSQFFGGAGGIPHPFFASSRPPPTRETGSVGRTIPDRVIVITVSPEEAYQGRSIPYRLKRKRYKGSQAQFRPVPCAQCNGVGKVASRPPHIPSFLMVPTTIVVCPKCAGLGLSVSEKDMETITETVAVDVPRYCPMDFPITIKSKTDELPGMKTGDVIFRVRIRTGPSEDRGDAGSPPLSTTTPAAYPVEIENNQVITTVPITLQEAIGGFRREIVFLDGRTYRLVLPPFTSLFKQSRLKGAVRDTVRVVPSMGFYTDHQMIHRGDWIISFDVRYPVGHCPSFWGWTPPHTHTSSDASTDDNDENVIVLSIENLPTLAERASDDPHDVPEAYPSHPRVHQVHHQECRQS